MLTLATGWLKTHLLICLGVCSTIRHQTSNIMNRNKCRRTRFGWKSPWHVPLNAFSLESTWYSALWYLLTLVVPLERQVWEQPGSVLTKDRFDWSRKWQHITPACDKIVFFRNVSGLWMYPCRSVNVCLILIWCSSFWNVFIVQFQLYQTFNLTFKILSWLFRI